jgi:hypothetical protein
MVNCAIAFTPAPFLICYNLPLAIEAAPGKGLGPGLAGIAWSALDCGLAIALAPTNPIGAHVRVQWDESLTSSSAASSSSSRAGIGYSIYRCIIGFTAAFQDCKLIPEVLPWWINRRRLLGLPEAAAPLGLADVPATEAAERAHLALLELERPEGLRRRERVALLGSGLGTADVRSAAQYLLLYSARVARTVSLYYAVFDHPAFFSQRLDRSEFLPAWRAATADSSPLGAAVSAEELAAIRAAFESTPGAFPWEAAEHVLRRWNNTLVVYGLVQGAVAGDAERANFIPFFANDTAVGGAGALQELAADYSAVLQQSAAEGFTDAFDALGAAIRGAQRVLDAPSEGVCATVRVQLTQVRTRWRATRDRRTCRP